VILRKSRSSRSKPEPVNRAAGEEPYARVRVPASFSADQRAIVSGVLSPEQFCEDVKTALLAGLPDALAEQTATWAARDAAAGRNIVLEVPREEDFWIGGAPTVIRYPTIEIATSDLAFTDFSLGNNDGDARPKLLVRALFQQARSPEELYRMGCRWFAALVSVVLVPEFITDVDVDVQRGVTASWRFNPETNTVDEIQSGVLVTFNLLGPMTPFFS
jgi:hypothetical protein